MSKKIIIKAPKGFRVRYVVHTYNKQIENVYCQLYDLSKNSEYNVGSVSLERGYGKTFNTHADLGFDYHGKGFGTLLYSKAIAWALNHGFKAQSSGDSSDMAKRVWNGKGLRKHFNIRKITKGYGNTTYTKETWYATKKSVRGKKK